MSYLVPLILLFIYLCMHACYASARPLGLLGKDTRWNVHIHVKDLEEHDSQGEKLNKEALVPLRPRLFGFRGRHAQKGDQSNAEMIVKSSYVSSKEEGFKLGASGTRIAVSLTTEGLDKAIKREDAKKQGRRSMLGDAHEVTKKSMDAYYNDKNTEDISEMDYAQPHRKSPIHNERRP